MRPFIGDAELSVGGDGQRRRCSTATCKRQPAASGVGQADRPGCTAIMIAACRWGWTPPWRSAIPLSRGRYGGDFFEKLYGEARTGLGRVEIGQTDGAGYDLAVTRAEGGCPGVAGRSADQLFPRSRHRPCRDRHVRAAHRGGRLVQLCQVRLCQPGAVRRAAGAVLHPQPGQGRAALSACGAACAGRQADIWEAACAIPTISGR